MAHANNCLFLYKAKVKEQNDKIAELEASLQSTENYWKSKYEAEVDKVAELQTEVEGFKSICNEYLQDESSTWEELRNWCDEKTDEIVEIKDELEDLEEKHEQSEEVLQELGYTYQEGMGYVHKDD